MRRSQSVRLVLLPLLASAASAAIARADAPPDAPPADAPPPDAQLDARPDAMPSNAPGMTPPLTDECRTDPDQDGCPPAAWSGNTYDDGVAHHWIQIDCDPDVDPDPDDGCWEDVGGVVRGGFGGYFHASGGGWGG